MDADEPDFSGNRDFMHQSVVRTFVQRRFDKGVDLTFTAPSKGVLPPLSPWQMWQILPRESVRFVRWYSARPDHD